MIALAIVPYLVIGGGGPGIDPAAGQLGLAAIVIGLLALLIATAWLIDSGMARRGWRRLWRLALGLPIAGYLAAVALAAVGIIR